MNAKGQSVFCKFYWSSLAGTHSLVWDDAVKISGADSDVHRRDLLEAIECGEYPADKLAFQIFAEAQADAFPCDVPDPTKLIPEELVPLAAFKGAGRAPGVCARDGPAEGVRQGVSLPHCWGGGLLSPCWRQSVVVFLL